jgi:ribonucleoside-diphosphate reductase beta chain
MSSIASTIRSPEEVISQRRLFGGASDNLRALTYTRYPWCRDILAAMRANEWKPEEVSLVKDVGHFRDLSFGEQTAIKRALAFLTNLDGNQVDNLAGNIRKYITDPDMLRCIDRQVWEEQLHVLSYSLIVETIIPNPMEIYDMYRQVPLLASKNDYIVAQGKNIHLDDSPQTKIKALVSNIILEGVFFYSGFLTFYAIGSARGTINGCIDMIRFIQRDEITHLNLFTTAYNARKAEAPEEFTPQLALECKQLFVKAAEYEIAWGEYQIEHGVLGLTPRIIRDRIMYLTELRAAAIGLEGIYPDVKNPVEYIDKYAQINNTDGNFFETKPKTYSRTAVKW